MKHVTIPVFSVFDGHGHLQQGGRGGGEESFRLRYHAYFIPFHIFLKYARFFAHEAQCFIKPSATYSSNDDDDDDYGDNDDEDVLAPSDIPL